MLKGRTKKKTHTFINKYAMRSNRAIAFQMQKENRNVSPKKEILFFSFFSSSPFVLLSKSRNSRLVWVVCDARWRPQNENIIKSRELINIFSQKTKKSEKKTAKTTNRKERKYE